MTELYASEALQETQFLLNMLCVILYASQKPVGIVLYTINPEEGVSFMNEHGGVMQDKKIKLLSLESLNYLNEVREDSECIICVIKVL